MTRTKKILSLFICLTMLFATFAVSSPQETEARTLNQVETDLKDCQDLLESLQKEKSDLAGEIDAVDKTADKTKSQLGVYIQEMEYISAEIAVTQETIFSYGIKVSEIEASILIQEENLIYYQDLYASIIKYSFVQGDTSFLQVLLESENFSDFLTRVDNLNYFLDYTDSVMKSIQLTMSDLETMRSDHASAMAILDEYNTSLVEKNATYTQKKADLEAEAQLLGTSIDSLQGNYVSKSDTIVKTNAKISALKKEREELLNSDKDYKWPIKAGYFSYVSSWFGSRIDPFGSGRTVLHYGIDIPAAYGTPIVAAKSGTVTKSELSGGYGNAVIIYHGNGMSTLYGHCSSRAVKVGDTVKQGDVIAAVGSTGSSTGNHLHFGIILNGNYVNPDNYLPDGIYQKKYNKIG